MRTGLKKRRQLRATFAVLFAAARSRKALEAAVQSLLYFSRPNAGAECSLNNGL